MEKKAWPYMAAIMDSEGCIGIYESKHNSDGHINYNLIVTISNKNRELMKWFVANFGGSYTTHKNARGFSENHPSEIFHWKIFGNANREAFLLGLMPYLTTKKEQARVAIDFLRLDKKWAVEDRKRLARVLRELKEKQDNSSLVEKCEDSIRNAYAAGLIDGDGTISGSKTAPDIIFYSTVFTPIRWMMSHFGGYFYTNIRAGFKPLYRWALSGKKNKERFLLAVIPHMIIKQEQAKFLLEAVRSPRGQMQPWLEKVRKLNCPIADTATTDTPSVS